MRNKLHTILLFLCFLPFMAQADETITYLHHDVLGSIIGSSDNAGNLQKTEYLSYGTQRGPASTDTATLGYTGKPHFKDLGLSYYGSRWYDPDAGRFTSIDPVAWTKQYAVHSFNRYAYANNNPYKYVDPDGRYVEAPLEAVSLGVGIASLGSNLYDGNYGSAALDTLGIAADVVLAMVPFAPGAVSIGIQTSRHADELVDVVKGGSTTLYRAVGPDELADIQKTGQLINRGSAEGKYFTSSAEHASSYAKQAVKAFGDQPYTTVKTKVPTFSLPSPVSVDGGIPAYVVPNKALQGLKTDVLNSMAVPR